jgi:hypothetical protein
MNHINHIFAIIGTIVWIACNVLYIKGEISRLKYPHYKFPIVMSTIATTGMIIFLWYCTLKH